MTEVTASKVGSLLRRQLGTGQVNVQGKRLKKGLVHVSILDTPATVFVTMDDVKVALDEAGFSYRDCGTFTLTVFDPGLHND